MLISEHIARMQQELNEGGDRDILFAWWDKPDFAPELTTEQWENVVSRMEDDADYSQVNEMLSEFISEEINE